MVATDVLLLEYVTAPPLLPDGRVVIANDASPYALVDGMLNVDAEKVDVASATVSVLLAFDALVNLFGTAA